MAGWKTKLLPHQIPQYQSNRDRVGSWDSKNGTQNEVSGSKIWSVQDGIPCGKNIHIRFAFLPSIFKILLS
jgi:hypothetical protein